MKIIDFIIPSQSLSLLTGCAVPTRPISDVAMGAGGAALANETFYGNPAATPAARQAACVAERGTSLRWRRKKPKGLLEGGGADTTKAAGRREAAVLALCGYAADTQPLMTTSDFMSSPPEQEMDRLIFQPTTKYLRIEE